MSGASVRIRPAVEAGAGLTFAGPRAVVATGDAPSYRGELDAHALRCLAGGIRISRLS